MGIHSQCAPRPPQTKMPAIKLTYFDLRARAEPARLLLAYSGQSYEDKRIPAPWDAPETWAARKFGLMGRNSIESAHVDEIVDVIQDTLNAGYTAAFMKDEKAKAEATAKHTGETIPKMLEQLENRLV